MPRTHFVIGLQAVDAQCEPYWHYGTRLRHLDAGRPNERITYFVENGGWTATVYRDGRRLCQGRLLKDQVAVVYYAKAEYGDYNAVIDDHIKVYKERTHHANRH